MSGDSDNLIEIRNLKYSRGSRVIFKNLNLTVRRGEVAAFMGPSGTGKTTLLRLITRQLIPQSGSIFFDGVDIATLNLRALYQLRQRFGMLFQNGALLTDLNVFENVAFPLREHTNLSNRLIRHVVLTKLHAVGLRGAADMQPAELSGGMARRVALARAMVMDPEVLIYDEPFVGLDPISMGVIVRLVRRMMDQVLRPLGLERRARPLPIPRARQHQVQFRRIAVPHVGHERLDPRHVRRVAHRHVHPGFHLQDARCQPMAIGVIAELQIHIHDRAGRTRDRTNTRPSHSATGTTHHFRNAAPQQEPSTRHRAGARDQSRDALQQDEEVRD